MIDFPYSKDFIAHFTRRFGPKTTFPQQPSNLPPSVQGEVDTFKYWIYLYQTTLDPQTLESIQRAIQELKTQFKDWIHSVETELSTLFENNENNAKQIERFMDNIKKAYAPYYPKSHKEPTTRKPKEVKTQPLPISDEELLKRAFYNKYTKKGVNIQTIDKLWEEFNLPAKE